MGETVCWAESDLGFFLKSLIKPTGMFANALEFQYEAAAQNWGLCREKYVNPFVTKSISMWKRASALCYEGYNSSVPLVINDSRG